MKITLKCPSKINLGLEILNKLPNGYHQIDTLMLKLDLLDVIKISTNYEKNFELVCSKKIDCNVENNTVYKTFKLFFEFTKIKNPGIKVELKKNIPFGSGLGGASSDSAGVLLALDEIFGTNLNYSQLMFLGAKIGCDVPFFLCRSPFARCRGTGEEVTELSLPDYFKNLKFVIVKPKFSVSTMEAYKKSDDIDLKKRNIVINALNNLYDLSNFSNEIFNNFEEVLDSEKVYNIKNFLNQNGAIVSNMSGSGSSIFGIFEDYNLARNCCSRIKNFMNDYKVFLQEVYLY